MKVACSSPNRSSLTRCVGVGDLLPTSTRRPHAPHTHVLPPQLQRERIAQVMFEMFNTAGLVFCDEPTLSLYAVGKNTGTVIDIGHSKIGMAMTAGC